MGFDRLSNACSKTHWKVRGIEFKPAPDLCDGCKAMDLASSFWKCEEKEINLFDHPSFKSLESLQNAATVCPLCALVLAQLKKYYERHIRKPLEESSWSQDGYIRARQFFDVYELSCYIQGSRFDLVVSVREDSKPPPWFSRSDASRQSLRPVDRTPSLDSSIMLIKTWLARCNSHPECRQERSFRRKRLVPDRLIDVGSIEDPSLRLVVTDPLDAEDDCLQYIALSYCWGTGNSYLATKSNYTSMTTSLDEQMLPQTLRDAIWVTRQLKVKYIWIDSLCILQDDRNDWAQQSAKMGQYYSNAHLTISASSSPDAQSGFLKERDSPLVVECGSVTHQQNKRSKGAGILVSPYDQYLFGDPFLSLEGTALADEPLTSRGWALQERVLSTRVLHFSTDQLIWECKHTIEFENGLKGGPQPFRWQKTTVKSYASSLKQNAKAWNTNIKEYSKCTLTDSRDRLPAIAGIAGTFQSDNPGVGAYFAGHWENHLPSSLLWYLMEKEGRPRAPSWSWSSKDGALLYSPMSEREAIGRLVGFDIHTDKSNPFGEVQYGKLDIVAPVIRVDDLQGDDYKFNFSLVFDEGSKVLTGVVLYFDIHDIPQEFYLLILIFNSDFSQFSGLLITPTGSTENQYQRIGVFGFLKDLNKSQLPPARTISLV